jgi:hypothetical protein
MSSKKEKGSKKRALSPPELKSMDRLPEISSSTRGKKKRAERKDSFMSKRSKSRKRKKKKSPDRKYEGSRKFIKAQKREADQKVKNNLTEYT